MAERYSQYNLSAELTWAQFIYEVNIGLKSSSKTNIWIDAGMCPSHIGFESAIAPTGRKFTICYKNSYK
ncbi:MAG: outer membrane beta-barrel protein [Saprospiraceae bacterium]